MRPMSFCNADPSAPSNVDGSLGEDEVKEVFVSKVFFCLFFFFFLIVFLVCFCVLFGLTIFLVYLALLCISLCLFVSKEVSFCVF